MIFALVATIFCVFPSSILSLMISEISLSNSVHVHPVRDICVPHVNWYVRQRLNFGVLQSDTENLITTTRTFFRRFGTNGEPRVFSMERECTKSVGTPMCELHSVIEIPLFPLGILRHFLIQIVNKLAGLAGQNHMSFRAFPNSYEHNLLHLNDLDFSILAPWTNLDNASDTETISVDRSRRLIYSPLSSAFLMFSNVSFNSTLPYNHSTPEFQIQVSQKFYYLIQLVQSAISLHQDIEHDIERLHETMYPTYLFPASRWLSHLRNPDDVLAEIEALTTDDTNQTIHPSIDIIQSLISTGTVTIARKDSRCRRRLNAVWYPYCFLDLITILPDVSSFQRFSQLRIEPVIFSNSHSNQPTVFEQVVLPINISDQIILARNAIMTQVDSSSLSCVTQETDLLDCQICWIVSALIAIRNPCLNAILSKPSEIKVDCLIEKVSPPDNLILDHNNTIIVIDSSPGQLEENCPGSASIVTSLTPVIQFQPTPKCEYKLVNGPDIVSPPVVHGYELSLVTSSLLKNITNRIQTFFEEINDIRTHFNTYGYIYILVLTGLVFLSCSTLLFIVLQRVRRNRTRCPRRPKRKQRNIVLQYIDQPLVEIGQTQNPAALALEYPSMIPHVSSPTGNADTNSTSRWIRKTGRTEIV